MRPLSFWALLIFVLNASCSTPTGTAPGDSWASDLADIRAAPDDPLSLTLSGVVLGGTLDITVEGGGYFDKVFILRSLEGVGDGPCFASLGDRCVDLIAPVALHDSTWTDSDGHAVVSTPIPERADLDGVEFCFQALLPLGPAGAETKISTPACSVGGRDSDGDGTIDALDPCPDDASDACVEPTTDTYEADFEGGVTPSWQCDLWEAYKPTLSDGYASVRISGSSDTDGVLCTDGDIASRLADAIRLGTNFEETCDGRYWTYCASFGGGEGELFIDADFACDGSNCPSPGHIIRPCQENENWGGADTMTCGSPSQSLRLDFEL